MNDCTPFYISSHWLVATGLLKQGPCNKHLNSAIPQMQRILNVDKKKKIETLKQLSSYPVNNGSFKSVSITEIINAYIIIIIIIIVISIMLTLLLHLFYQILHTHPRIGVSGPVSLDHPTWSF